MQERFTQSTKTSDEQPCEGTEMNEEKDHAKNFDQDIEIPVLRMVKSADDGETTDCGDFDSDAKNYDQYVKENGDGKNLQDVIKHLVNVIRKKDNQINSLLTTTQNSELVQGI